jgi:hypothetical protein
MEITKDKISEVIEHAITKGYYLSDAGTSSEYGIKKVGDDSRKLDSWEVIVAKRKGEDEWKENILFSELVFSENFARSYFGYMGEWEKSLERLKTLSDPFKELLTQLESDKLNA